ncbi:hypothetical protein HMPREF9554_00069 [Treponema phagedenis F0421]|nr:hypothetical protein HMPREF9554_00069 [Treponema phagedenis F0421]
MVRKKEISVNSQGVLSKGRLPLRPRLCFALRAWAALRPAVLCVVY